MARSEREKKAENSVQPAEIKAGIESLILAMNTMFDFVPKRALTEGQIAFLAAISYRDELAGRKRGRPPKKSPPVGISIPELAAKAGVGVTTLEEAIYVDNHLPDNDVRRWWILTDDKKKRIELCGVYDDLTGKKEDRDRRFTPDDFREATHDVFDGDFLDAASERLEDGTNPMHAPRILMIEDDGTKQSWESKTHCNPPFSKKIPFLIKAVRESRRGNGSYFYLPDDMSTKATHFAIHHCVDFLALDGRRVKYKSPVGKPEGNPNFGTLIFGFGMSTQPLADALRKRGWKCTVVPGARAYESALNEIERLRAEVTELRAQISDDEEAAA